MFWGRRRSRGENHVYSGRDTQGGDYITKSITGKDRRPTASILSLVRQGLKYTRERKGGVGKREKAGAKERENF